MKKKAEKMTKELRLELKENANKLNSAIDASKKEAEAAFASAKDRVMAMTVKKAAMTVKKSTLATERFRASSCTHARARRSQLLARL